jgi:hypothetical protein
MFEIDLKNTVSQQDLLKLRYYCHVKKHPRRPQVFVSPSD